MAQAEGRAICTGSGKIRIQGTSVCFVPAKVMYFPQISQIFAEERTDKISDDLRNLREKSTLKKVTVICFFTKLLYLALF
jgi:hypothetical protein